MPIIGILTFMSKINTTSERLKARHFFICRYFSFYEQLKFRAQLSMKKKMYNLEASSEIPKIIGSQCITDSNRLKRVVPAKL